MDLAALAVTFGTIFLVELPDKTFIATLVLSTRYRGLFVWIGVGLAFGVQTVVAVLLGTAVSFLPDDLVHGVAGAIFLLGAILLLREAPRADQHEQRQEQETEEGLSDRTPAAPSSWRAVITSFLVLFAAEWGDLSQLLTISLVGRFDEPLSVFVGAWAALLAVSALAVVVGRWLLRHVRLSVIHYGGAIVCLVLAGLTAYELLV